MKRTEALGMVSGAALVALAVLAVVHGELGIGNQQVAVVVVVNALIKLIFAGGLVALWRFTGRRLPGALWGTWLLGALCVPYLVVELIFRIPGLSVRVTLPGANVLDTANLRESLSALRPAWHGPVDIVLTVICLVALLMQMAVLISTALTRPQPPDDKSARPQPPDDKSALPQPADDRSARAQPADDGSARAQLSQR